MSGEMRLERVSGRTFRIWKGAGSPRHADGGATVLAATAQRDAVRGPSRFATGIQRRRGDRDPEQ